MNWSIVLLLMLACSFGVLLCGWGLMRSREREERLLGKHLESAHKKAAL